MGTYRGLARTAVGLALLAGIVGDSLTPRLARAANYEPGFWMLNGTLAYDVVNPTAINDKTRSLALLQGLLGARVSIERGLFSPNWTHWVEFGLHSGAAEGGDFLSNGKFELFNNAFSYLSVLPVGVTWWVNRTSYIDVGLSLAGGLGLSPKWTLTTSLAGVVQSTELTTGGSKLIIDGRIHARFWLGKYLGFTLGGAVRNFVPNLTLGPNARKVSMNNVDLLAGITVALGGVKGTGRTFVELLPAEKPKPEPKAAPSPPAGQPKGLPPAKR